MMSERRKNQEAEGEQGVSFGEVMFAMAFIGVVAAVLLPDMGRPPRPASVRAKQEMADIENAIASYKAVYGALPRTEALQKDEADFTYGTFGLTAESTVRITSTKSSYQANNAEIITILMARSHPRFNKDHVHNPQKKQLLNPKVAADDGKPGLGPKDNVYRDPWGSPYIISIDTDGDGWTCDAFYSSAKVSQGQPSGVSGLRSVAGMGKDDFASHGLVMIWSFGPDGKADPLLRADEGVNADNVLSWR